MDTNKTLYKTRSQILLGNDDTYYKYIFKKTEKIVCSVFFILRSEKDINQNDRVVKDLEDTAQDLLETVSKSLRVERELSDVSVRAVGFALIALESRLRVVHAARLIPESLLQVFLGEIDTVSRSLKNYLSLGTKNPLLDDYSENQTAQERTSVTAQTQKARPTQKAVKATATHTEVSSLDRLTRIKTILRDKGQSSIKDIAEQFPECSEKTIQRDLQGMVKDGSVVQEGSRRWTRYSMTS